jgi:hypothetical protein
MNAHTLKLAAWYGLYAPLMTIITLGGFIRFHLITVRERTLGGVRAGTFGEIHVYVDDKGLVVSRVTGKRRIPFRQLADAETGVLKVRVDATSGHGARFGSWSPSTVAAFIGNAVPSA